jgi:membrane protein
MNIIFRAIKRWWNSDPATHGAALAYYAIFSLAPLFIVLAVVLGEIFGRQAVEGKLVGALQNVMGQDVSNLMQTLLVYAHAQATGKIVAILSTALTIIGSLALFSQVERALASVWKEDQDLAVSTTFLKTKVLAVCMIIVLGLLVIISFILNAFATLITAKLGAHITSLSLILSLLGTVISVGYVMILFIFMYKYLPGKFVSWGAACIGGIVGGTLFIIGRHFLALYITNRVVFSTYGAASAILLVFVWFYYSAQIFFFGGALTYAIDETKALRETTK